MCPSKLCGRMQARGPAGLMCPADGGAIKRGSPLSLRLPRAASADVAAMCALLPPLLEYQSPPSKHHKDNNNMNKDL